MIVNDIKIKKNKIMNLSKFLFLKNPKMPNGNKIKKMGKTAKAVDFIKVNIATLGCSIADPD